MLPSPLAPRSLEKPGSDSHQDCSPRRAIKHGIRRGIRLLKQSVLAACVCATTVSFTGCMTVHNGFEAITNNGYWNDTVVTLRNRNFSAKAWHKRKHHFCRNKHLKDFANGFRAGYESVCSGGDGCTPAFPPQEYWSWEYQTAEGHQRTQAWFSGFPHGARAAEEDGVANWNQIPMSAGMQQEFQQAGMFDYEGALYPIPDPQNNGVPVGEELMTPTGIPMGSSPVPTSQAVPGGLPEGVQIVPNGPQFGAGGEGLPATGGPSAAPSQLELQTP